jgi:hypothetical protein
VSTFLRNKGAQFGLTATMAYTVSRQFSKAWNSALVEVPVGAPADVCELEYCSALRQTASTLRENGSLTAHDIQVHLLSRHSIRVPIEDIEQRILVELAGGATYQVKVPKGMGLSHHGGSSLHGRGGSALVPTSAPTMETTATAAGDALPVPLGTGDDNTITGADQQGVSAATAPPSPMRREPSRMMITKTTPVDLVQQTAMLLIPELQKIRTETGGKLPVGAELFMKHDDLEQQQQQHASLSSSSSDANARFKKSMDSSRMAPQVQIGGGDDGFGLDIKLMIEATLLLICEQAGVEYGAELTFNVMRDILHSLGEDHWDEDTIEQMVRAACADGTLLSGAPPVLDANTFLRALTSDLSRYRSEWTDSPTTHVHDVNSNERVEDVGLPPPPVTSFYSMPSIDYTAETHSNYLWTVLSWFLFMVTFGSYLFDKFNNQLGGSVPCDPAIFTPFGCRVVRNSFIWLEVFLKVRTNSFGQSQFLLASCFG